MGLRVEIPIIKNCGLTLIRGKTCFEGDKVDFRNGGWGTHQTQSAEIAGCLSTTLENIGSQCICRNWSYTL